MEASWEPLSKNLKILVSASHRFNTDTLLLADFSMPRPGERCADLGSGCGTIPLLWCHRSSPGAVLAVELQPEAVDLMARSLRENSLEDKITLRQGDIRDYKAVLPHQGLGLIACNPPYYPAGAGLRGDNPQRTAARHGESLTLGDLAQAARYGLKYSGRLCLCLPVFRLAEAVGVFSGKGLEPKRLRLVQERPGKAPYLFLMECRLGGKPGLTAEPTLLLQGEDGAFSPEMTEIYGDYAQHP